MSGMGLPPPPGTPPQYPAPGAAGWSTGASGPGAAPGPVAIRPLRLGEVLDGAFKLFVANWRTILLVAGIFIVPLQLLAGYLQRDLLGAGFLEIMTDPSAAQTFFETGGGPSEDLALLIGALDGLLVTPLVTGAVAAVVGASYLGQELGVGGALGAAARRWWALILSWVLLLVAVAVPFFVAGGLIAVGAVAGLPVVVTVLVGILVVALSATVALGLGALFAAVVPAIVLEGLGPIAGIRRSVGLLRPRVLPVVGTVVVTFLLVMAVSLALGGIPQTVGMLMGGLGWVLVAIGGILASLVTTPLYAIVLTLLYFDGRVRHEGLDLQLAADGLGRPAW